MGKKQTTSPHDITPRAQTRTPRIGLALGGGAARGWAHIGVIRALESNGIKPEIVTGTSIGALVGAAYAGDKLDVLEKWVRSMTRRDVVRYLDFTLSGGGLIEGERLRDYFAKHIKNTPIEDLARRFACVATELHSGREVWLQDGPVLDAIRASYALPGLFTPAHYEGQWLVDGGLVNPVPVSLCRALGAEIVIAVNLNDGILGKHIRRGTEASASGQKPGDESGEDADNLTQGGALKSAWLDLKQQAGSLLSQLWESDIEDMLKTPPGLFDVIASSINIMQVRITSSRMAGDPPEVMLRPRTAHIELLEFDRADEAIEAGEVSVRRMLPVLQDLLDQ